MDGECCLENSGTALSPKAVPKEASEVRSSSSNAAILWSTRLRRSRSASLCFASESSVSFCKSSLLCSYSGLARETPLLLRVGVTAAANSNFVRRARNVRSDFCVSLFSRATLSLSFASNVFVYASAAASRRAFLASNNPTAASIPSRSSSDECWMSYPKSFSGKCSTSEEPPIEAKEIFPRFKMGSFGIAVGGSRRVSPPARGTNGKDDMVVFVSRPHNKHRTHAAGRV
mmetsp:Transcript_13140/g.49119  ORF Transcript_13140/g.49119 Transcript_13140/m.49119 type:complete len:230 (+) Transcript_13140:4175-4864(+)